MLAGELYDCGDSELLMQWHKAKDLIRDYNNLTSDDLFGKNQILKELLGGSWYNLWITLTSPVTIVDNFVIGVGSIVLKDIPSN